MIPRTLAAGTLTLAAAGLLASAPRAQDVRRGAALFAETCAACHGAEAKGDNGPNLTARWAPGARDERVTQTIRGGIAGTVMPPSAATDEEIRAIVAYLRTLAAPPPAAGETARATPERPQRVVLVTASGEDIRGERRNEDAFSIQIEDDGGRLRGFLKKDLRDIVRGDAARGAPARDRAGVDPGIGYRDLLDGLKDPSRWLTFSGDYTGRRHSPLTQITRENVGRLAAEWTFQTGTVTRGRGFLDAYDPASGARIWRFYTVPAPGEPGSETWPAPEAAARGGGGTWMTGTYDPELNLLYWGTGNPNPDYYGDDRKGDNLYTNSLVAIDARTGAPKWHYQFTPHDTHDWDSNHVAVLADVTIGGAPRPSTGSGRTEPVEVRKVVMVANRNGFFYVLDRRDGTLLVGKPFTDTTWAREIGRDGRPIVLNDGTKSCVPDQWGGTNFNPPSFDPALSLFFVNARETCATFVPQAPKIAPGRQNFGGVVRVDREQAYGALRALDPATGERRWEFRYPSPSMAGVMTTASGLVFAGDNEGNVMAFDARTGANLWRYATGNPIWGAAPMTYLLDGRQHVVIASGATLLSFALPDRAGS